MDKKIKKNKELYKEYKKLGENYSQFRKDKEKCYGEILMNEDYKSIVKKVYKYEKNPTEEKAKNLRDIANTYPEKITIFIAKHMNRQTNPNLRYN